MSLGDIFPLVNPRLSTDTTSPILMKNNTDNWIQLAGHPEIFAPASSVTVWKRRLAKDSNEYETYLRLQNDKMHSLVPQFYQQIEYNGQYFIEIENLLKHFHDPNIMDIKLGTRTFLESEVKNQTLRTDLYNKMILIDPNAPNTEERKQKALTKLRYMQFREQQSSSAQLGFRIDAIRMSGEFPNSNLQKIQNKDQIYSVLKSFLNSHKEVSHALCQRLKEMCKLFESSIFFKTHEFIGSSLLIIYDEFGQSGIWLIDFSKTFAVPDHIQINHRSKWQLGNYEDGFLTGMDNLIKIWNEVADSILH